MKIVQTIHIGTFTINTIGGASIVQIGSSGLIQSHSESYETREIAKIPPGVPIEMGISVPETVEEPFVKTEIPLTSGSSSNEGPSSSGNPSNNEESIGNETKSANESAFSNGKPPSKSQPPSKVKPPSNPGGELLPPPD